MNVFTIGGKDYTAPSAFSELNGDQLLYFAELYAQHLPAAEILRKVSKRWLNWNYKTYRKISEVQLSQIAWDGFSWLYDEFVHGENLLPEIMVNGETYYGFHAKLDEVKVIEFALADAALKRYQKTKSERELLTIIALLYRPANGSVHYGDLREEFIEARCLSRINLIENHVPKKYWYAVMFNYTAVRRFMQKEFKEVFGEGSGPDFGIPGMVHEMSGPELGTVDYIMHKMNIRNLLFFARKIKLTQKKKPVQSHG